MRRWALAPVALLLLPLLGVPGAAAAPAESGAALCASDPSRGGVPVTFPVRACVDGSGITLHNDRTRPVVVQPLGDVGTPVRMRAENSVESTVVRLTAAGGPEVLLPGEVARWPIGAGTAFLTVGPLPVAAAPEMAGALRHLLDDLGEEPAAVSQWLPLAALIRNVDAVLRVRETCAEGRNFLGTTACDVEAAAAIGSTAAALLDRAAAAEVLPALLDPGAWDGWSAIDPDWPDAAEGTLWQLPAPLPAPLIPPAPDTATGGGSPPSAAAPGPSTVRVNAPAPPPAADGAPVSAPAPAAVQPRAAAPAPAAAPPRAVTPPRAATPPRAPAPAPAPAPTARPQQGAKGPAGHDRDRDDRDDRDRGKGSNGKGNSGNGNGNGNGKGRGNGR